MKKTSKLAVNFSISTYLVGLLICLLLGYYLLIGFKRIIDLEKTSMAIDSYYLAFVPMVSYLIISTIIVVLVRSYTGQPLKDCHRYRGLVYCLTWSFVVALIISAICGLFCAIKYSSDDGLVSYANYSVLGFIYTLCTSLPFFLIASFIAGKKVEFETMLSTKNALN